MLVGFDTFPIAGAASSALSPPTTNLWGHWHAQEAYDNVDPDSGSLITSDAASVHSLKDLSGNGRHASQSTSSARPTHETSELNGLAGLNFDGSNDILINSTAFNGDYTGFVVCKIDTITDRAGPTSLRGSSEREFTLRSSGSKMGAYAGSHMTNGPAVSTATNYLLVWSHDVSAGTCQALADDGTQVSASIGTATGGTNSFQIGGDSSFKFDGMIYEVLAYEAYFSDLKAGDALLARQYLDDKYNLGLGI